MRSTSIWEERIWEKVKIYKSNIDVGAVSSDHKISSLNFSGSSSVVIVLCRTSNVNFGIISIRHNISYNGRMVSTSIWEERIWEKVKILKSNLDAVSISHCFESIIEVNVFVGSIVLWSNSNGVSWSIGFEFITNVNILLLSWNNSHYRS